MGTAILERFDDFRGTNNNREDEKRRGCSSRATPRRAIRQFKLPAIYLVPPAVSSDSCRRCRIVIIVSRLPARLISYT